VKSKLKKILFIIPSFKHGGTNKSLLNLIACLGEENYNISVLSLSSIGPYFDLLNEKKIFIHRNILLYAMFDDLNSILKSKKSYKYLELIFKIAYKISSILFNEKIKKILFNLLASKINKLKFDTVIALQEGRSTEFASYLEGYKIAWVRCDYSEYMKEVKQNEIFIYMKFDNIICVSEYTQIKFLDIYPSLNFKCHAIHNMIDFETIIEQSLFVDDLDLKFDPTNFTILSVGRLSKVKRFDFIPLIAYKLKSLGYLLIGILLVKGKNDRIFVI
jgi:glycosyltransferase involved in cell wall biosynthesis